MSYRQSLYPSSSSTLGNSATTPSPSAINSLLDKQRQVQHFHQILKHSQNLLQLYEGYTEKYNVLVGGSEAVGDVVEHWQNVFRATSLALGSIHTQKQAIATRENVPIEEVELPRNARPDQLVRLPVEDDSNLMSPSPTQGEGEGTPTGPH
ncbi:uncharacterized protein JCM6883_001142 [Sporobolomyces salmoneus]|uniref:uncharacterized protein n=1 Tax=Sporobolomyces salmoneus TaxID=183962 RepID=UPI003172CB84